jgi:hypothetical protein
MMEYILFDVGLRDRFVEHAKRLGVACDLRDDHMGWIVAVREDLADDVAESLEACYDGLQEEQSDIMSQSEGGFKRLAGVRFDLPDGQTCMVPLQPDMANRLLACFSHEEIQTLFGIVAQSALNRDNQPLCATLKAGAKTN